MATECTYFRYSSWETKTLTVPLPQGEEMTLSGERKRLCRRTDLQSFLNLNSQGIKRVDWPQSAQMTQKREKELEPCRETIVRFFQ